MRFAKWLNFDKFKPIPLIAQLVEQLPLKEMVGGSIPSERTRVAGVA